VTRSSLAAIALSLCCALSPYAHAGDRSAQRGIATGDPGPARAGLRLLDDRGRPVVLPAPPRRIVSLAPHATELLFAAGAGDRVVGVDASSSEPPQVRSLPRLQTHPQPDAERLLALRPDLVVAWGAGLSTQFVARVEAAGVPVFVSEPRALDDVASTIERLAPLSADPDGARALAAEYRHALAALRARYAAREPVRVFVQVWSRPLVTLSDRDTVGDALRTCGARNVFGAMRAAAPQVDAEAVLQAAPRLIVSIEPSSGDELWRALGVLAPQGAIAFAQVDAAIQRPTPAALAAIPRLCEAVDRVRRAPVR